MRSGIVVALLFLSFLACLPVRQGKAQKKEINLSNVWQIDAGPIMRGQQVYGYYFLCMNNVWEGNRKSLTQKLVITDVNLEKIDSIQITRSNQFSIWAAKFNGRAFAFVLRSSLTGHFELLSLDKDLKQLGSRDRKIGRFSKFWASIYLGYILREEQIWHSFMGGPSYFGFEYHHNGGVHYYHNTTSEPPDADFDLLVPIENEGFLFYDHIKNNGRGYRITRFTNSLNVVWSTESKELKGYDVATPGFADSSYVGSIVNKVRHPFGAFDYDSEKKYKYDLLVNNAKDGSEKFRASIEKSGIYIKPMKVIHLRDSNQFIVIGKYYNFEDRLEVFSRRISGGLIQLTFGSTGSLIGTSSQPWNKEITGGRVKQIAQGSDGKIVAILEGPGGMYRNDNISIVDIGSASFSPQKQFKKIGSDMTSQIFIEASPYSNEFTIWYIDRYSDPHNMLNIGAVNFDGKSYTHTGSSYKSGWRTFLPSVTGRLLAVKYVNKTVTARFFTTADLKDSNFFP